MQQPAKASTFVGREGELAVLLPALEDARTGKGGLFLLAGEPGIGKSRLAEEVAGRARAANFLMLAGRCWEAGGAPAYWPWVQSIRSYLRAIDVERLRTQLGGGVADVAQILPELRRLLPDTPEATTLDPDAARFRLFDSTSLFVRNVAEERPLLLVLEDLHAADTPSLLLLQFMVRMLADMRVLILATYRDVEVGRDHPLAATLVEVAREPVTRRVTLTGLRTQEVRRFIEAATGVAPREALVDSVIRETEGNPLFVGEVVRLLAAEGRLSGDSSWVLQPIPQGIRDVIGRRIGLLSERCSNVLGIASVLGREFPLDILVEISERQTDELLEILDEAAAARLVADTPGALGSMRFSHALIRDTLYEDLSTARRMNLHRRAGRALEHLRGDRPEHLAELAHHFFAAAPMGETEKAIDYSTRGAEAACSGVAFEEGARLYRMALQALQIADAPDDASRFDILLALGDALSRAGDLDSARSEFLEAVGIARRRQDAEGLARIALGYGGRFLWTVLRGDPHFVELLEEALEALGDASTPLRIMVMARLAAGPLRDVPDSSRRWLLSAQALEMARMLGDLPTLAYAVEARVCAIMGPDHRDEALELCDEMERLGRETVDAERIIQSHVQRLVTRLSEADMQQVSLEKQEIVRMTEQLRQAPQSWFLHVVEAQLAILAGRFEEAEDQSVAAYEAGRHAEPYALFAHRLQMLWLRIEQGRHDEMREIFRDSAQRFAAYPLWRSMLPVLLLSFGGDDEARAALDRALSAPRPVNEDWLLMEGMLADAATSLNQPAAAASLYEELLPYADLTVGGAPTLNTGSLHRPLGRLGALLGRLDDATEHFQAAIARDEQTGARPDLVHSLEEYARMLLKRDDTGDAEQAETLFARALTIASDLGMAVVVDRIKGGGFSATAQPEQVGHRATLRREGEYWLIAFEDAAFRLRDTKGLHYLARLLAEPGRELHVLDLVGSSPAAAGDAGEILDAEAKAAYRRRLRDLEGEISEAQDFGDSERAGRAEEEKQMLLEQLAGAIGLGGRDRRAVSASERARVNVSRAVKAALDRIRQHDPQLSDHLDATIKMGTFCSYRPDPRAAVAWRT